MFIVFVMIKICGSVQIIFGSLNVLLHNVLTPQTVHSAPITEKSLDDVTGTCGREGLSLLNNSKLRYCVSGDNTSISNSKHKFKSSLVIEL